MLLLDPILILDKLDQTCVILSLDSLERGGS